MTLIAFLLLFSIRFFEMVVLFGSPGCLETRFVGQAAFNLAVTPFPQLLKCWDYSHEPLHPAHIYLPINEVGGDNKAWLF